LSEALGLSHMENEMFWGARSWVFENVSVKFESLHRGSEQCPQFVTLEKSLRVLSLHLGCKEHGQNGRDAADGVHVGSGI
jgi:hypothetical protein